jgi:hypothetical protein
MLFALFFVEFAETEWSHPRCLPSIRTLNGASWLRCILGSDFTTQVRHSMTNLDC